MEVPKKKDIKQNNKLLNSLLEILDNDPQDINPRGRKELGYTHKDNPNSEINIALYMNGDAWHQAILPDEIAFPIVSLEINNHADISRVRTKHGIRPDIVRSPSGKVYLFDSSYIFDTNGLVITYTDIIADVKQSDFENDDLPLVDEEPEEHSVYFDLINDHDREIIGGCVEVIKNSTYLKDPDRSI